MPKVSVIVPVYGVEKYIEKCAVSLFEQTLDDIEYLFIDDCSPDDSISILKEVINRYPNRKNQIIIHKMERNSGQATVRKWGMQNATGDFIIHCDSDDWVNTSMYELMYDKAIQENADIVACDYYEYDGVNIKYIKNSNAKNPNIIFEYFQMWIRLTKKDIIDKIKYYPTGNMGEDRVYAIQTGLYAKKHVIMNTALYYYNLSPQSICRTNTKENSIKNFKMRYDNTLLIEHILKTQTNDNYRNYLIQLKLDTLWMLLPFISDSDVRNLWQLAFPEMKGCILTAKNISIIDKIRYYLIQNNIYQLFKSKHSSYILW